MSEDLKTAIKAAKRAGGAVMEIYNTEFTTEEKSDRSPVTKADLISQESIFKDLKDLGYGFLGEESENKSLSKDGKCWIVDPLDGTKDFIEKTGDFSVMIGLVEDSEVIMGVVYLPAKDTLYFAEKGKGAFKKEGDKEPEKIQCSETSDLKDAKMVVSRFHLDDDTKHFMERAEIKETVPTGSIGIKLSLIAEGQADIYLTTTDRTFLWDVCAPEIILREAGGEVTDLKGEKFIYKNDKLQNKTGIVAHNGKLSSVLESVL